jgi:hypothetical protein
VRLTGAAPTKLDTIRHHPNVELRSRASVSSRIVVIAASILGAYIGFRDPAMTRREMAKPTNPVRLP